MAKILVVDDEIGIRELLSEILHDEGHDVLLAGNAAAARAHRERERPDLVLLDIWMPDTDGVTLLKEWSTGGKLTMPVIMMSGHATIDTAVEATRIGAMDFLEKPIGMQKLLASVAAALDHGLRPPSHNLSLAAFPRSAVLRDLKKRLDQLATGSPALLLRSSPGGFIELAARTLQSSNRPWLDLGHDSTALSQDGLEAAAGGVLYVEELARLTRLQQKNLLFAAERLDKYNLKLVAGTEADGISLAAHGWDDHLLARTFPGRLSLPALAEIKDDLPDLAAHLLAQLVENEEVLPRRFSAAALNQLRLHHWTGGYAEFRATIKSLALAALNDEVDAEDVTSLIGQESAPLKIKDSFLAELMDLPLREAREIFERRYFEYHLASDGSNMTRLAETTGLERTHLYRKLKDLGLR